MLTAVVDTDEVRGLDAIFDGAKPTVEPAAIKGTINDKSFIILVMYELRSSIRCYYCVSMLVIPCGIAVF